MSGEVITIIVSALVAAVSGPLGSWIGRKVERAKYEVEVGKLRAELKDKIAEVKSHELENVRKALYEKALANREARTYTAHTLDEMVEIASTKSGYIKAMWCGDRACEDMLKEKADVTSRCIPFGEKPVGDTCVCCGKPAKKLVFWGKAY